MSYTTALREIRMPLRIWDKPDAKRLTIVRGSISFLDSNGCWEQSLLDEIMDWTNLRYGQDNPTNAPLLMFVAPEHDYDAILGYSKGFDCVWRNHMHDKGKEPLRICTGFFMSDKFLWNVRVYGYLKRAPKVNLSFWLADFFRNEDLHSGNPWRMIMDSILPDCDCGSLTGIRHQSEPSQPATNLPADFIKEVYYLERPEPGSKLCVRAYEVVANTM